MKWILFVFSLLYFLPLHATELFVQTQNETHIFQTDIADTPQKQKKGLMFKKSIPVDYAMTFLFSDTKVLHMWMKNTYLPLDMIFFDEQGVVTHIHENAEPFNERLISSFLPAKGVIEVLAGTVHRCNIQIGDLIILKEK